MDSELNAALHAEAVPMTPALIEALAGLRDLHLVPIEQAEQGTGVGVSADALAGVILGVILVLALTVVFYRWRHRHRLAAHRELTALRATFARDGDAAALSAGVNAVLKRAATGHARSGGVSPPALSGEDWTRWLLQRLGRAGEPGAAPWAASAAWLASLPYRRQAALDAAAADALLAFAAACVDVLWRPGGRGARHEF